MSSLAPAWDCLPAIFTQLAESRESFPDLLTFPLESFDFITLAFLENEIGHFEICI
jgi:hypothetical protein